MHGSFDNAPVCTCHRVLQACFSTTSEKQWPVHDRHAGLDDLPEEADRSEAHDAPSAATPGARPTPQHSAQQRPASAADDPQLQRWPPTGASPRPLSLWELNQQSRGVDCSQRASDASHVSPPPPQAQHQGGPPAPVPMPATASAPAVRVNIFLKFACNFEHTILTCLTP